MGSGYSHTSNTVKLYKHMDKLALLQNGQVVPIMVHLIPTHRCQMDCSYCCFKNRRDKKLDMPFDMLKEGISSFHRLGTRSVEFTGGGDPTLYPWINEALEFMHKLNMHIGLITNSVDSQLVKYWQYCNWIRISLNTLDCYDNMNIGPIKDSGAYISACYIWNEVSTPDNFKRIARFAEDEKIVCRVAPDCIKPGNEIDESVEMLQEILREYKDNKFVFLSDFNITTERPNFDCYIHMIKPCFYVDGYVYSCPSTELAWENNHQIDASAKVCKYDEILDFYKGDAINKTHRSCSYCKYVKQQVVLEEVLTETTFNEFA